MARGDVVDRLVHAALTAMEDFPDEYGDRELLSACFTIAMRCSDVIIQKNEALRPSVQQAAQLILLRSADSGHPN